MANHIKGAEFVLTGKMWTERFWIEDAIQKLGGYVSPRMHAGVSYLVQACGQWGRQTDKYKYAKARNIPVIDDKQLYEWILEANEANKNGAGNGQ